ncbi:TPA: lecithin retinol acyltransferase family protein [Vibrio parahaemolyticus]|nr:lecithin retinol acyltransferase family protein [Vibrio parahaemolyticus]HCE4677510.1 lecithin retinol acyltransferase family protein [Vibrio parahaemolyticus]
MGFFDILSDIWQDAKDSWEEVSEAVDHPKLARGTVLRIEKVSPVKFDHFGVYAGNREVIHFSEGKIRKDTLSRFIDGAGIFNGNHVDVMSFSAEFTEHVTLEESYSSAISCIGMEGYDLFDNNCEHFATWCRTGVAYSGQSGGSYGSDFIPVAHACSTLNVPRTIGRMFNDLGMERSRHISISGIVDK